MIKIRKKSNLQVSFKNLGLNFEFKFASSNLFSGLPLEAKGCSFSPRLSHSAAVVAPALQLQCPCPPDPQACPALAQQMCHPLVDKTTYYPVLVGCLSKDNTIKPPGLLQISVWTIPAAGMQLFKFESNPLVNTYCL